MVNALLKVFTGTSTNSNSSNFPNKDQEASNLRQTTLCRERGRPNNYHHSSKPSPGDSSEGPSLLLIVQQGTPLTLINTVQIVVRLKMTPIFSSIANCLVQFGSPWIHLYELTIFRMKNDGIQLTIQAMITDSTPNDLFQRILITMWYLRKARNDTRF
jgi:hypothetical protein